MRLERIVVGVDGSGNGAVAVAWAAQLAEALGAEVIAVHALGLLDRTERGAPAPAQPHRAEILRRFETEWCALLDASPVRSRRVMRDGPPAQVLLTAAREEGADLVVVGSRGMGDRPELLLGSTSTQVVQQAPCPVTVVPRPAA